MPILSNNLSLNLIIALGLMFVAQWLKLPLGMAALHIVVLDQVVPLLTQLPDNTPVKAAANGLSVWVSVAHMGNLDGIPSCRVWPGPGLAFVTIWDSNQ